MQLTGTVQRVSEKQLPSGLYHSFMLDDAWYRTGKIKAKGIEAGYKVQFDFTEDKYGKQVDIKSIKFKAGEAPPATNSGSKKAVGRDDFWSNKEVRDIEDHEQGYILAELVRYLRHEASGVTLLTKMGAGWKETSRYCRAISWRVAAESALAAGS